MRDNNKTLKELLKLDMATIEAVAPNPFCLTRMDVIVSILDPQYSKRNLAELKRFCGKDKEKLAVCKRFSKVLWLQHYRKPRWLQHRRKPRSPRKARVKDNEAERTINKNNAASSPSTGGSSVSSTSTPKTDIPELPDSFKAIIASLGGLGVTFVMQRKLTKTDLEPNNSRLAMPEKQINQECKFLAHKDAEMMRILEARDGKGRLTGMEVGLVEPSGEVCHNQVLKKWNMTSASTYNLASSSWCDIAKRNRLKKDHLLNIWCFNDASNKFYFLLHHVGSEPFEPSYKIKN